MVNDNLGYLIYVAHVILSKAFNQSIHRILPDLTGIQFTVLIYLYYHQSEIVTQKDVIDYLHLRHPTVRHIVKLMLIKHLLVSGPLSSDHRQVQLTISSRGNRLIKTHLTAINHDFHHMNQRITNHMTSSEVQILKMALNQLVKNFEN